MELGRKPAQGRPITTFGFKLSPAQILKLYRPTNMELPFLSMICEGEKRSEHERKFLPSLLCTFVLKIGVFMFVIVFVCKYLKLVQLDILL